MKCPNCDETLVITDRSGVEIDYCPKCRGVWLDRGELDKIIDRSLTPAQPVRGYDNRDDRARHQDHNYDYKKKRKDSFLGDLFDF